MNKKITLRLDSTSKLLLVILAMGVWCLALKPITSSSLSAQTQTEEQPTARDNIQVLLHLTELVQQINNKLHRGVRVYD